MSNGTAAPVVVAAALAVQAVAVSLDVNTIVLAVIGLTGTSVTGYLALRMATVAAESKRGAELSKEVKDAQIIAADSMKEIHVAVNSSKTVLENKLEDVIKQNVELAKKVATLEEKLRGAELAKAVASAPPMVVLPAMAAAPVAAPAMAIQAPVAAAPVPAPEAAKTIAAIADAVEVAASAPTRMGEAITELKAAAEETSVAADKTVDLVDKQDKQAGTK